MIQVRTETRPKIMAVGICKHFITCPQCLYEDWFYNYVPRTCRCGFVIGNVVALMNNVKVRTNFHMTGEIND